MAKTYEDGERATSIISKNDRGDFVKVCRVIPKDPNRLEAVDLRNFYTKDGVTYPTQKGIRLHSEILVETLVAALKACEAGEREEILEAIDGYVEEDE